MGTHEVFTMKKIILMVILMSAVYSQCDKENWRDYYPDKMQNCMFINY